MLSKHNCGKLALESPSFVPGLRSSFLPLLGVLTWKLSLQVVQLTSEAAVCNSHQEGGKGQLCVICLWFPLHFTVKTVITKCGPRELRLWLVCRAVTWDGRFGLLKGLRGRVKGIIALLLSSPSQLTPPCVMWCAWNGTGDPVVTQPLTGAHPALASASHT